MTIRATIRAQKYWIGVASREHVRRGVEGGFCQLGHGKHAPVKSLAPGDWIVYYSPRETMQAGPPLQAFTALGVIAEREPYLVETGKEFFAWRRDVVWRKARETPVAPLLDALSFITDKARWGYPFRRGSFTVLPADFAVIAAAMGVSERAAR